MQWTENEVLSIENSNLCLEETELMAWTEDSGNMQVDSNTEMLIAALPTYLLKIALEIDSNVRK